MNEKANILIEYFVEGQSIREIARNSKFSRNTIRKYVREHTGKLKELDKTRDRDEILTLIESLVEAPQYDSSNRSQYKLTEAIKEDIGLCIKANEEKKSRGQQKLLMKKIDIYEFLKDKGHDISYPTICKYIRENHENKGKEAYIKQLYLPGQTLQFDYGEVKLTISGRLQKINLALFTTGHGFFNYGRLYQNKKMISFLDAHVCAFKSLGGVYHEIVYDNLKQAVRRFVGPTEKEATEELTKLSLYYGFKYRFCNVRRGNEKGNGKCTIM